MNHRKADGGPRTLLPSRGDALAAVRADPARLLQLHWLSLLMMAALALVVLPALTPGLPQRALLGVTLLLLALNLMLTAGIAWPPAGRGGAFAQLLVDLLTWGAFLYFAGGPANPAISLLLPLVAVGAAMLPARQAWALAATAVAVYSLLWHFHHPLQLADAGMAMHWHLAGMWLSFACSALTVVWFVSRLNAALSRREDELAAANAARARDAYVVGLGQLAAGAAHRLGTPLGTLRILVDEVARRPGLAAEAHEDLALMRAQVDHCKDILASLTREAGRQRAEGGGVLPAGDWLEAVVARWRDLRPHAAAVLHCDAGTAAAPIVADASLGEALHNLLDNAANANRDAGHADASVEVRAALAGAGLVVDVADRGTGMPARAGEAMPQGPLADRPAGMGIGLVLAYGAVEHHGGTLSFHPRPGGGTIARLAIPLQEPNR